MSVSEGKTWTPEQARRDALAADPAKAGALWLAFRAYIAADPVKRDLWPLVLYSDGSGHVLETNCFRVVKWDDLEEGARLLTSRLPEKE